MRSKTMNKANPTVAEVGMFAITRVALGVGVGLPDFAPAQQRCIKGSGVALSVAGGATTIPFVVGLIARKRASVQEIRGAA
jgi:hypothetical protein